MDPLESLQPSFASKFRKSSALIRRGVESDAARVTQLLQSHYNWININNSPFSVVQRRVTEEGMADALARFPSAVAEYHGTVIGFSITIPQEPTIMQIRHIYVDDEYRRNGLGKSMVQSLESQIMADGYTTVMATSSTQWYPGKELPTRLFKSLHYSVQTIAPGTELYLHTLNDENAEAVTNPETRVGIRHIHYSTDSH